MFCNAKSKLNLWAFFFFISPWYTECVILIHISCIHNENGCSGALPKRTHTQTHIWENKNKLTSFQKNVNFFSILVGKYIKNVELVMRESIWKVVSLFYCLPAFIDKSLDMMVPPAFDAIHLYTVQWTSWRNPVASNFGKYNEPFSKIWRIWKGINIEKNEVYVDKFLAVSFHSWIRIGKPESKVSVSMLFTAICGAAVTQEWELIGKTIKVLKPTQT